MATTPTPLIFDEHCSVLADWIDRGFRGKTLVYVDAHLDLQFIRDERLQRLRAATTRDEVVALEKPNHLLPDGDFVYGIENFLYAASEVSVVDHLVWVSPPHVDIRLSPQVLDYVQQIDGVTFEELSSIRQTAESCYEATLLGLDITFCGIEGLKHLDIPEGSLVDIDTDFFVALPSDRAWLDPRVLHAALVETVANPSMISIARSVGSGFMPLRYRYFADYLAALYTGEAKRSAHYAKMFDSGHDTGDEDPIRLASAVANRHLALDRPRIDQLREALAADSPPEAHVAFGLAYAARGAVHEALDCYRAYGKEHPQLALEIAGLLAMHGDTAQRRSLLEVAATEDACRSSALLQLADIAISQGELSQARVLAEQVHELAPAWMEPLSRLAWLHEQQEPRSGHNPYRDEFEARSAALQRLVAS